MRTTVLALAASLVLTLYTGHADAQTSSIVSAPAASASAEGTKPADSQARQPLSDAKPATAPASPITRWLELQQAQLSLRFREVKTSAGATNASHVQDLESFKLRFKFDATGQYGLNAGLFSGSNFSGGWNTTGPGTGEATHDFHVKQLFFDAQPVKGLSGQIGSLYFWRGESTEITTFDNDGYLSGERISVKRPKELYFDEILFTQGYIGDLTTPNVFDRANRLDTVNYRQFAVAKAFAKRAGVSAEFTTQDILATGVPNTSNLKQPSFTSDWLRVGARLSTPELKAIDTVRFESYRRWNKNNAGGFSLSGDHAFTKRFTASLGYATIDRLYGGLNGDRYGLGRRVFSAGSYTLTPEFTLGYYITRAFANDFSIPNRTRAEVILGYNLLKTLQRTHLF
jgi:hypothetical protein